MIESHPDRQPDALIAEVAEAAGGHHAPAEAAHAEAAPAEDAQENSNTEAGIHDDAADQPPTASAEPINLTAPPSPSPSRSTVPTTTRSNPSSPVPVILAAAILLGGGWWLLRRLRGRGPAEARPAGRKAARPPPQAAAAAAQAAASAEAAAAEPPPPPPPEPVEPDSLEILVCGPSDAAAAASAPPLGAGSLPLPLAGVTFLVSEDVDLVGTPTTLGRDPYDGTPIVPVAAPAAAAAEAAAAPAAAASASCGAVSRLQAAGAVCLGKAAMQPLGLDVLGANYGNPYNKAHVAGGGQTGSAAGVSTGLAQLALTTDLLGSARVPAACCGLYCYRSTPGALGQASTAAAGGGGGSGGGSGGGAPAEGGEAIAVMAADPGLLLRAAQTLGAPGSFDLRGEIVRFVVAEDLFGCCAVEYQPAGLAIKRAILKWAGSEQAGAVQLCSFLADNTPGWQSLTPDELLADIGGLPRGLAAWSTAARVLRAAHVNARLPPPPREAEKAEVDEKVEEEKVEEEKVEEKVEVAGEAAASSDAATTEAVAAEAPAEAEAEAEAVAEVEVEVAETRAEDSESAAKSGEEQQEEEERAGAGPGSAAPPAEAEAVGEEATAPAEAATDPPAAEAGAEAKAEAAPLQIRPPPPTPERLAAAREAARQLYDTLRHTVKPDTVIVLPVVPTAPLKRRAAAAAAAAAAAGDETVAAAAEAAAWEALAHGFNCLASLAQCPVVVVPLGTVADGTPLAAALMGCSRFDARLLAVAAKMGPIMQEAFQGVKRGLEEAVRRQNESQETVAAAAAAPSAPPAAASGRRGGAAAAAPPPPAVDPRRLERAERFKARGNDFFRADKYADALTEYGKAIHEHPDNPVYYNNRAMAGLKIFRFEQAEEDCNRALKFELKEADKAKALLRRATARTALQKYAEAEKDLRQVLSVEPNNRQAREDLQTLQQMKADMAAAQQRMVADFQAQRRMAAGATPGAPQPGGGGGSGGGGLPAGFDPSALPPGMDFSQLAAAAGGNPEALMGLMQAAAAAGGGGGGAGMDGFGGLADLGPMFGGGGGARRGGGGGSGGGARR
ncbi:hypothetical protein PLESTB_001317700 [Pleodorina starrii]|uniref:Amidase domain-containing protein n=1 Tax=Pleodorina starrii TaxID=330485 RepID=A0A9W6F6G9_9CHLO|nr:hypothetical protein PLESTM_001764800 [Pleodorina starrii]GLC58094.1 hypothetical protein PLESTB_001317700 [Pleodorina starrii]GLC66782.1 hypothetical protein PLESTF_000473900 [Pleodorina starrii]